MQRTTRDSASENSERTLLLAGGTDGIGFAFLMAECARCPPKYTTIYVLGRDFTRVDTELPPAAHDTITKLVVDILDTAAMRQVFASHPSFQVAKVDDFVNTIGTFSRGVVADLTDEDVAGHFELNCIANINLIRAVLPKLQWGGQLLVVTASLAVEARSPYALQSATKAALHAFVNTVRLELRGKVRVMTVLPPSVQTQIFAKAGDARVTTHYPPAARVAATMRFLLDGPTDICIPELRMEQHQFDETAVEGGGKIGGDNK